MVADADWSTPPAFLVNDEDAVRLGSEPQADRSWWNTVLANGEQLAGRPVVVDFSLDAGLVRKVDPEGTNFAERYAPRGFDVTKVVFFAPDVGDVATFMNNRRGCDRGEHAARVERRGDREPQVRSIRRGSCAPRHSVGSRERRKRGADARTASRPREGE